MMLVAFFAILLLGIRSDEWDASTYPNPTLDQFKACGMRSQARLCDPDSILSEAGRIHLDQALKRLEDKTEQKDGPTFCDRKGLTAILAIARHVSIGTADSVKGMTTHMLHKWKLDSKCKKAMLILVSINDMKLWAAKDENVPIWTSNFTELFEQQKSLFHQNDYQEAISNILIQTSKVVEAQWRRPNDFNGRLTSINEEPDLHDPRFGNHKEFTVPSVPGWFWAVLLVAIVPITCCCLCSYLCCCRDREELPSEQYSPETGCRTGKSHVNIIFGKKKPEKQSAAYDFDNGYSDNRPGPSPPSTNYSFHPNQDAYSSHLHHGEGRDSWARLNSTPV